MTVTNIEKVQTVLQGIANKDPDLAVQYVDNANYREHNPRAADGATGLREFIDRLADEDVELNVIRAFEDGPYVVTQATGRLLGDGDFFDVFRLADSAIVEHWAFAAKSQPPNKSGHTQADGPARPTVGEDTAKNKALVREYYETVHINGHHDVIPQYFLGDFCVRHEPGVADGVGAFVRDLKMLTQSRTIDEITLLLGSGDFVFLAAKGTHESQLCLYIDLYRVRDGKLIEHWGFPQAVGPQNDSNNTNGML